VAEVTYCVGLPSVASDDGVAAGEPTESFSPVAVVMGAKALSCNQGHVGVVALEATEKLGAAAPENQGMRGSVSEFRQPALPGVTVWGRQRGKKSPMH
jgi:hypothetical protein